MRYLWINHDTSCHLRSKLIYRLKRFRNSQQPRLNFKSYECKPITWSFTEDASFYAIHLTSTDPKENITLNISFERNNRIRKLAAQLSCLHPLQENICHKKTSWHGLDFKIVTISLLILYLQKSKSKITENVISTKNTDWSGWLASFTSLGLF